MALLRHPLVTAALTLLVGVVLAGPVQAQLLTQTEALALAFPEADSTERRTAYLTEGEVERALELAGEDVRRPSSIVTHYVALQGGAPVGVAYFDAHRVRTLNEVLMVVVGLDDRVGRIETVSFREPPEYEAPEGWLELFEGRRLDEDLSLKGDIPTMTGATLTARAVTRATRRILALHAVVRPFDDARADR